MEAKRDDENFAYVTAWEYGNQVMLFYIKETWYLMLNC
jgi:hypothetical protein